VSTTDDVLRRIDARQADLDAMTPTECRGTAALLRDSRQRLTSDRQRQLAEELAQEFEALAARVPESRT
jgi:hypothetical protein